MRKWVYSLFALISAIAVEPKSSPLEECLLECYRVDTFTAASILEKFSPLLDKEEYEPVVNSFIEESRRLNIYSAAPSGISGETLAAIPFHKVLFENPHIRISWAVTQSGEQEPPQIHPWKTLMVIIQPSQFYSVRGDGVTYEDDWPIGVYLLDPLQCPLACKNIGTHEYQGLVFEIKTLK